MGTWTTTLAGKFDLGTLDVSVFDVNSAVATDGVKVGEGLSSDISKVSGIWTSHVSANVLETHLGDSKTASATTPSWSKAASGSLTWTKATSGADPWTQGSSATGPTWS